MIIVFITTIIAFILLLETAILARASSHRQPAKLHGGTMGHMTYISRLPDAASAVIVLTAP